MLATVLVSDRAENFSKATALVRTSAEGDLPLVNVLNFLLYEVLLLNLTCQVLFFNL